MTASRLTILVVLGEASIASAIESVLTRRGHTVRAVASARLALESTGFDVLVCDLSLGATTGFELLAGFHRRGVRPHTVFLADSPTLEDCRRALRMGAGEFLAKPFRLEDLVRAVESRSDLAGWTPREPAFAAEATAFERSYPAAPPSIEEAARDVSAYALRCGVRPATRARIGSATSEIVDNARRHGYAHGRGTIHVEAGTTEREFVVYVRDQGLGFDASHLSIQGMRSTLQSGLARAAALSEDIQVTSSLGKGTTVRLAFAAHAVEFDDESGIDLSELDFLTPDLARRVLHTLRRPETSSLFRLSPALCVVVGRLACGVDPSRRTDPVLRS